MATFVRFNFILKINTKKKSFVYILRTVSSKYYKKTLWFKHENDQLFTTKRAFLLLF